jgi:aminoglycoside phosphotransferase family enzyme
LLSWTGPAGVGITSADITHEEIAFARLAADEGVDPALFRFLSDPASYEDGDHRVVLIESHLSLVFLAGNRAYKMKRSIKLDRQDYQTLESRRRNCERELALNRILSPDIYLGLAAVTRDKGGRMKWDGPGEAVEWFVVMRRLEVDQLLDHALARNAVTRDDIRALVATLGPFYAMPIGRKVSGKAVLARWSSMMRKSALSLRRSQFGLPLALVDEVLTALARFLDSQTGLLLDRADAGWIRDCHGDLRPQHVYLGPPLRLIDRLEFDERLRWCDPFEEIMDLGLECERLGAGWILPMLVDGLAAHLGARPSAPVLGFYAGTRACLRARFAIEHVRRADGDPAQWRAQAIACLELARKYAIP